MVAAFIQKRGIKIAIVFLFVFVVLNILHHDSQKCQKMDVLNRNLFCNVATKYVKIRNNSHGFSMLNFNITDLLETAFGQQIQKDKVSVHQENDESSREHLDLSPVIKLPDNLKCRIPKLDPFHREVLPYIKKLWTNEKCLIKPKRSRVENGYLIVDNLQNVEQVTLTYILRVHDDYNRLESQLIFSNANNETLKG